MDDEKFMRQAIELAKRGEGWTAPNPLVGAVILNKGEVVGAGFHQKAGTPHAEIHALAAAKERAKGGTIYVNLEPCCHYGKTPPCTDALIKAGIKRVVMAMTDPNPKVAGGGIKKLREAGIEVVTGVLEREAQRLNEVFLKQITEKRPFIALKAAVTLDGKIATKVGSSKWITGEDARESAHKLRHRYDSIMVGIGTVLADDPLLNTRIKGLKNPIKVVIDSNLKTPLDAQVLNLKNAPVIIFTAKSLEENSKARNLLEKGVEIIACPGVEGKVDLALVLKVLYDKKITSILVEGGAKINGTFFEQKLIDKIYLFMAPKLVGSHLAPGMMGGLGIGEMQDAVKIEDLTVEKIGQDFLFTGDPKFKE